MQRALGIVILSAAALYGAWNGGSRGEPVHAAAGAGIAQDKYLGAQSCAAAACHNAGGLPGTRGSEYTTWVTRDPHARAVAVLYEKRSEEMVKRLDGDAAKHPTKTALCLNCHVQPGVEPMAKNDRSILRDARFDIADGVSCESCHGPASRYLTEHSRWGNLSRADKQVRRRQYGMLDTIDLTVRAESCVTCHVGKGDIEVNHDLIAAGHPRLHFEFAAYHANLPKHWNEQKDKAGRPEFEARAWLVGQLASARAAIELLGQRAANTDKPWPEFAEYNCFACHHDLKAKTWRQQRTPDQDSPPGALPWSAWYTSLVPTVERVLPPGKSKAQRLQEAMQVHLSDALRGTKRKEVANLAVELTRALQELQKEASRATLDEATLHNFLQRLAGADSQRFRVGEWDAAVQVYLGAAALHHALADGNSVLAKDQAFTAAVRALGGSLDSPAAFDPAVAMERLKALRAALPASPR